MIQYKVGAGVSILTVLFIIPENYTVGILLVVAGLWIIIIGLGLQKRINEKLVVVAKFLKGRMF